MSRNTAVQPSPSQALGPGAGDSAIPHQGQEMEFQLGERVTLAVTPRYLKTADPMPMLRPPDLVSGDEVGLVSEIRARSQLAVRFRRGTFLIDARDLRPAPSSG